MGNVLQLPKLKISMLLSVTFLMFALVGCFAEFTTERIAENNFVLGNYEVEETIYRQDGFPDATYERVYRVGNGRFYTKIGTYSDESRAGITNPPEMMDGWLVIYSSSHLFLWHPDKETRHFTPFQADGWVEYADQFWPGLNGHYDYRVTRFWVRGGRWFIKYNCTTCIGEHPEMLIFASDNEGETYRVLPAP